MRFRQPGAGRTWTARPVPWEGSTTNRVLRNPKSDHRNPCNPERRQRPGCEGDQDAGMEPRHLRFPRDPAPPAPEHLESKGRTQRMAINTTHSGSAGLVTHQNHLLNPTPPPSGVLARASRSLPALGASTEPLKRPLHEELQHLPEQLALRRSGECFQQAHRFLATLA